MVGNKGLGLSAYHTGIGYRSGCCGLPWRAGPGKTVAAPAHPAALQQ